jgi:hypothetical protein
MICLETLRAYNFEITIQLDTWIMLKIIYKLESIQSISTDKYIYMIEYI